MDPIRLSLIRRYAPRLGRQWVSTEDTNRSLAVHSTRTAESAKYRESCGPKKRSARQHKSSGRMASKGFPNPIDVHIGHRIRLRRGRGTGKLIHSNQTPENGRPRSIGTTGARPRRLCYLGPCREAAVEGLDDIDRREWLTGNPPEGMRISLARDKATDPSSTVAAFSGSAQPLSGPGCRLGRRGTCPKLLQPLTARTHKSCNFNPVGPWHAKCGRS